jgi:hypothetical protein
MLVGFSPIGCMSVPCRPSTLHTSFKPRQGEELASTHCHVSYGSGPCLLAEVGSGAATCPTALNPASLLGRAPVLQCAPRLRCCHMSHGSRPCLPARKGCSAATCPMTPYPASQLRGGSDAIMCPMTLRGPRALRIKEGLAAAAKAASGDGRSGRSARRRSVDSGLNGGLLFSDTWSYGLRMISLKEEGGARATQWPVAWEAATTASRRCRLQRW